jgi:hypothetical protein
VSLVGRRTPGALAALIVMTLSLAAMAAQLTFKTPEDAFAALIAAACADDTKKLIAVLGPEGESFVVTDDPVADKQALQRFVTAYDESNHIDMRDKNMAILTVGKEEWPLPIPAVKKGKTWFLDSAEGKEEIIDRRIGRNELSAMAVCLCRRPARIRHQGPQQ